MNDMQRLLEFVRRRLRVASLLRQVHLHLTALAVMAIVLAVTGKAVPAVGLSPAYGLWGLALIVLVALLLSLARWANDRAWDRAQVAAEIDARLHLKERFSTALLVAAEDDAFARASIDDAAAVARGSAIQHGVRREFPLHGPRNWWVSPILLALALSIGLFVPQGDLFAREASADSTERQAEVEEVERIRAELEQSIKELARDENLGLSEEEIRKFVEAELPEKSPTARTPDDPDEARREAFRKYNSMMDLVRDRAEASSSRQLEALNQKLGRLASDPELQDSELANALAQGDFSGAREQLAKMQEAMANGNMAPEQQEQMGRAMEQLARNLNQLANANQQLEAALRQAGVDPNLANNPGALQEALQNAANLTDQERQQLQDMAQATMQANQQLGQMAQAAQQMAQGARQQQGGGQPMAGQMAQGMANMDGMLSQAEMLEQEMMAASVQLAQLQQQAQQLGQGQGQGAGQMPGMGQGLQQMMGRGQGQGSMQWMQQNQMMAQGGGMGRQGIGTGGRAERLPTQGNLTPDRPPTMGDPDAPITGQRFFDDPKLVRGESLRQIGEIINASRRRAEEELNQNRIPKRFEPAVKTYFGDLTARARIVDVGVGAEGAGEAGNTDAEAEGAAGAGSEAEGAASGG